MRCRGNTDAAARMPPLGAEHRDAAGAGVVAAWIASLAED
jgi:hypothetical protein